MVDEWDEWDEWKLDGEGEGEGVGEDGSSFGVVAFPPREED